MRTVHPITFSCYTSVSEFGTAGEYYAETLENFSMLSYNVIHQMGPLYDTLYYTLKHQKTYANMTETYTEAEQTNWWFKLGIYYGTATYLLFYTPPTIDPFDPLTEYAGLDSGAHLDLDNTEEEDATATSQEDATATDQTESTPTESTS